MVKYLPTPLCRVSDTAFSKTGCLVSCLQAVKSWFDIFIKYETTAYMGFPLTIWKQLGGVFFALCHLTLLKDPAWDTEMVRRTCNSSVLLDQIATNLMKAEAEAGWTYDGMVGESVSTRSVKVIQTLKSWVESLLHEPTSHVRTGSNEATTSTANQTMMDEQQQLLQLAIDQLHSSATLPPFEANNPWSPDFWGLWDLYTDGHQDLGRF